METNEKEFGMYNYLRKEILTNFYTLHRSHIIFTQKIFRKFCLVQIDYGMFRNLRLECFEKPEFCEQKTNDQSNPWSLADV